MQQTITFASAQYNSWTAEASGTDIVATWVPNVTISISEAPATGAIGTTGTGGDVSLDGRPLNFLSLTMYWWADANPTSTVVQLQIATGAGGAGGWQSGDTNATGASTGATANYLTPRVAGTVYYGFQKRDSGNVRFNTATSSGNTIYNDGVESTSWAGRRIYAAIVVQTVPNAPTLVTGSTVNTTAVSLSWTAPTDTGTTAGINGYRVFARLADATANASTDWFIPIGDTGSTSTTATVTGLYPGTSYVFMVSALNSATDLMLNADIANVNSVVTSYTDIQAHSGTRSAVTAAINTAGGVFNGTTWLASPNVQIFNGTAWVPALVRTRAANNLSWQIFGA